LFKDGSTPKIPFAFGSLLTKKEFKEKNPFVFETVPLCACGMLLNRHASRISRGAEP
jgi:hypothetical protein